MTLCGFLYEGHGDGCQLCYVDRVSFRLLFDVDVCDGVCLRVYHFNSQCVVAFDLRVVCLYEVFGVPFPVMDFGV